MAGPTSARVGEIGIGLLLLIVLWGAVLVMAVFTKLMERWQNYTWLAGGLTLVLTVILVALPRAPETLSSQGTEQDFILVGRTLLLIGMGLSLVVAGCAVVSSFGAQQVPPLHLKHMEQYKKLG